MRSSTSTLLLAALVAVGLAGFAFAPADTPAAAPEAALDTTQATSVSQADLDAVRVPLDLYLRGQAEGDGTYMRQAFHPDARIVWMQDGAMRQRTAEEFAGLFTRGPAPDEADRHRRIASISVTGDVAVATLELDYPRVFLTDYMTLMKTGDGWKIVHKTYTRSPARVRE